MSFNFFSLDYIYYPVSGIMWLWHKVFGSVLGEGNALAWVLSIIFLVFTLRAIMFKPFMKQMDSQLKMQAVQPEMKKLREKYKDDKTRLSEEMMKLNKEAGVNPLASCLPLLVQAPVFIGLFHVLRMFQPIPNGFGGWTFRDNVYFFGRSDVELFGQAKLPGGANLIGSMTMDAGQLDFLQGVREAIITWGIPLTILAGIATHLTSRRSVARQAMLNPDAAANPQSAIMNKLMLWLFPLFVIMGGPFFPIAILFYWLANNSWTFGQLWVAHRMQDRKKAQESLVVEEAKTAAKFTTPKPGARPGARPAVASGASTLPSADVSRVDLGKGGKAGEAGTGGVPAPDGAPTVNPGGSSDVARPRPGSRPTKGSSPGGGAGRNPRSRKKSGKR